MLREELLLSTNKEVRMRNCLHISTAVGRMSAFAIASLECAVVQVALVHCQIYAVQIFSCFCITV